MDYVFECTGKFNSKDKLESHLKSGAKKVVVSAPCKNADKTVVIGVNESELKKNDKIISAASCTTNCLAPVAHVLNENFEIENGFVTTLHPWLGYQNLLDGDIQGYYREAFDPQQGFTKITGADGTKQIDEGLVNRRRQELELAQNLWKAPE